MSIDEYSNKFAELIVRCDIRKTTRQTISRFRTRLKLKIRKELIPHIINSLEYAYNMILEYEHYLKVYVPRRFSFQVREFATHKVSKNDESSKISNTASTQNRFSDPTIRCPKDNKGKIVTETLKQSNNSACCFNCHKTRTLCTSMPIESPSHRK
ncbi:unnamed protein product [Musa acuminata var. zebrina]